MLADNNKKRIFQQRLSLVGYAVLSVVISIGIYKLFDLFHGGPKSINFEDWKNYALPIVINLTADLIVFILLSFFLYFAEQGNDINEILQKIDEAIEAAKTQALPDIPESIRRIKLISDAIKENEGRLPNLSEIIGQIKLISDAIAPNKEELSQLSRKIDLASADIKVANEQNLLAISQAIQQCQQSISEFIKANQPPDFSDIKPSVTKVATDIEEIKNSIKSIGETKIANHKGRRGQPAKDNQENQSNNDQNNSKTLTSKGSQRSANVAHMIIFCKTHNLGDQVMLALINEFDWTDRGNNEGTDQVIDTSK